MPAENKTPDWYQFLPVNEPKKRFFIFSDSLPYSFHFRQKLKAI
jgi:hypothetical protein